MLLSSSQPSYRRGKVDKLDSPCHDILRARSADYQSAQGSSLIAKVRLDNSVWIQPVLLGKICCDVMGFEFSDSSEAPLFGGGLNIWRTGTRSMTSVTRMSRVSS